MTQLREGGRMVPVGQRKAMRGMLSTKKFMGGDTWFKVVLRNGGRPLRQKSVSGRRKRPCTTT